MIDVSIIITYFNSLPFLEDCLSSIDKNSIRHSYEIIVVDDASNNALSKEFIKSVQNIKYMKNAENLGFVRSTNIGIKMSQGRYVLILNNDTVVKVGTIDKLIDHLDKTPDAGAVGPKLLNCDGSIQLQCRRSFPTPLNSLFYFTGLSRIFPKSERFGRYLLTYIDDSKTQEVDSLCGAAMMVRREAIDKVGLMDESYYMYGDDIDWCYRIKQAGWKVLYHPEAEIVHYGGMGGSREQSYRNIIEFYRAMTVFYSKHYARGSFLLLNWAVYSGIWLKCLITLIQNTLRKDKYVGTKKP